MSRAIIRELVEPSLASTPPKMRETYIAAFARGQVANEFGVFTPQEIVENLAELFAIDAELTAAGK